MGARVRPLPLCRFSYRPLPPGPPDPLSRVSSSDWGRLGLNQLNDAPKDFDAPTYDELHRLRGRRGYAKQDPKSVL